MSFGAASTVDDVLAFVDFVKKFFGRGEEVVQLGLKEKADSSSVGGNKGVRAARLGTLLLRKRFIVSPEISAQAHQPLIYRSYQILCLLIYLARDISRRLANNFDRTPLRSRIQARRSIIRQSSLAKEISSHGFDQALYRSRTRNPQVPSERNGG